LRRSADPVDNSVENCHREARRGRGSKLFRSSIDSHQQKNIYQNQLLEKTAQDESGI